MAANPIFFGVIRNWPARILNADTTSFKTLVGAGANGSKVESISATNTDPSNGYTLQFSMTIGGVDHIVGEVNLAAGVGTNTTTKAVNVLNFVDLPWLTSDGVNEFLLVASGSTLSVKSKSTVSGSNVVALVAFGGDA